MSPPKRKIASTGPDGEEEGEMDIDENDDIKEMQQFMEQRTAKNLQAADSSRTTMTSNTGVGMFKVARLKSKMHKIRQRMAETKVKNLQNMNKAIEDLTFLTISCRKQWPPQMRSRQL